MASMSNYLESAVLYHLFKTPSFTKPPMLAVALCSGTVLDADAGTLAGKELGSQGNSIPVGYTRQLVAPLDANWTYQGQVSDSGNMDNAAQITFGPAGSNWGTVTWIAILDSGGLGSGNLLLHGPLVTPKVVSTDDTLKFNIGDLDIYLA